MWLRGHVFTLVLLILSSPAEGCLPGLRKRDTDAVVDTTMPPPTQRLEYRSKSARKELRLNLLDDSAVEESVREEEEVESGSGSGYEVTKSMPIRGSYDRLHSEEGRRKTNDIREDILDLVPLFTIRDSEKGDWTNVKCTQAEFAEHCFRGDCYLYYSEAREKLMPRCHCYDGWEGETCDTPFDVLRHEGHVSPVLGPLDMPRLPVQVRNRNLTEQVARTTSFSAIGFFLGMFVMTVVVAIYAYRRFSRKEIVNFFHRTRRKVWCSNRDSGEGKSRPRRRVLSLGLNSRTQYRHKQNDDPVPVKTGIAGDKKQAEHSVIAQFQRSTRVRVDNSPMSIVERIPDSYYRKMSMRPDSGRLIKHGEAFRRPQITLRPSPETSLQSAPMMSGCHSSNAEESHQDDSSRQKINSSAASTQTD